MENKTENKTELKSKTTKEVHPGTEPSGSHYICPNGEGERPKVQFQPATACSNQDPLDM